MEKRACRRDPARPAGWFLPGARSSRAIVWLPLSCLLAVPSMSIAQ